MSAVNQATMATQFGMINNLRTGNFVVDTVLCFLVPLLITLIANNMTLVAEKLKTFIYGYYKVEEKEAFRRTIEYTTAITSWGSRVAQSDEKNNLLQKAITLYLAKQNVEYNNCDLNLTAVKRKKHYYGERKNGSDDEEEEKEMTEDMYGNTASQLKQYQLSRMPPPGKWVNISEGIEFCQRSQDTEDAGKDEDGKSKGTREAAPNISRIIFEFKSYEPKGAEIIETYIQAAYASYTAEIARNAKRDKSRHFYIPSLAFSFSDKDEGKNEAPKYKRYKLTDNKKFSSLFFQQKQGLLQLVDHFLNQTGKYAIDGFPHKLGVMLHGPPGTGKTSLIKALAQYTNRSIVSIPLGKVRTNSQLMDLILDHRFKVQGEDLDINLAFKNTIFVMEDVDCASNIVLKRESAEDKQAAYKQAEKMMTMKRHQQQQKKQQKKKKNNLKNGADSDESDSDTGYSDGSPSSSSSSSSGNHGSSSSSSDGAIGFMEVICPDRLDLSGILNVLDGVVDCPGRLLIMTTNHPEKLDPALIRPGRIDKKLELGYLDGDCACQMIQHYFQITALDDCNRNTITSIVNAANNITPAALEQLCAQHETIEELVDQIQISFLPPPPTSPTPPTPPTTLSSTAPAPTVTRTKSGSSTNGGGVTRIRSGNSNVMDTIIKNKTKLDNDENEIENDIKNIQLVK